MPRVAKPPRGNGEVSRGASRQAAGTQARSSPMKYGQHFFVFEQCPDRSSYRIPLNDDAREKAARQQSRQALHDLQMNQLKAAASPRRRLNPHERAPSTSPKTPRSVVVGLGKENDGVAVVGGSTLTPMKRVPILANFEEWMKMATDNKINATNSWNFALIDYFHDMTLLKEGDGVNFQKASCTLDGCVKIYTSRVDSVATETGKLLSGLADSGNKKKRGKGEGEDGGDGEEEEEEEGEEGEEGSRKRGKRRTQRSSEATLAPSFATLQLKKFELEFSVDPLFKKASADFDEGGAKGLLLNHLSIDAQGRIVFDSSDDARDGNEKAEQRMRSSNRGSDVAEDGERSVGAYDDGEGKEAETQEEEGAEIDITSLGAKFFPELNCLDTKDICPSLKNFDLGDLARSLDIPFLKAPEDWRQERNRSDHVADQSGIFLDGDNPLGFDDDDDGALGGFDIPPDTGFGEGGEAWAKGADIEPQVRFTSDNNIENEDGIGEEGQDIGAFDARSGNYIVSLNQGKEGGGHEDVLNYFDQALSKNWAGPEHWRIRRIKDVAKSSPSTRTRKEKEPFEIDFSSPLNSALAEVIYTPAATSSSISLPKTQWNSKTRNLLPDDKHFNSRQLLRLFLKPKARMGSRRKGFGNIRPQQSQTHGGDMIDGEMDEAFWAHKEGPVGTTTQGDGIEGNYDANFFQDDGPAFPGGPDDDEEFADAREHFSPALEGEERIVQSGEIANILEVQDREGAFGNQLVTQSRRLRPEYVQYARVAKKVDVRRLKEEMWKGMKIGDDVGRPPPQSPSECQPPSVSNSEDDTLKFTSVMNSLQSVYSTQAMEDISTSYCFICLLHLANEKGLVLEDVDGLTELNIKVDPSAEMTEGPD
ncbi:hypothetical protein GP486_000476 [Trichoglossum hirsutum]|uniref:Condensin complex subunit 2 n=1 Tax=Trichoglossum hirsutum TaxID=265104 RepID=A0A9P8RTI2_9PEZI|nr:hypothetical protein GP486_000476 [Trichoglossum hirsutum]